MVGYRAWRAVPLPPDGVARCGALGLGAGHRKRCPYTIACRLPRSGLDRAGAFDFDEVGAVADGADEFVEEGEGIGDWGVGGELEVGGGAVGEDEGGGAEDAAAVVALFVVGADLGEEGAVGEVVLEAGEVELGGGGGFEEGGALAVVFALFVLGGEEGVVEAEEGDFPLVAGGDGGVEGGSAAAAVGVGLLPELPVGAFDGVDLFEREVAPGDLEPVPDFVLDLAQPDRRAVDVGSTVVEVDVDGDLVVGHEAVLLPGSGSRGHDRTGDVARIRPWERGGRARRR